MIRWFRILDISDLWKASIPRGGTLTAQELAKGIADRIAERLSANCDLDTIKDNFLALADDPDVDFDDLDIVYGALCNYGDTNQLWIKTF